MSGTPTGRVLRQAPPRSQPYTPEVAVPKPRRDSRQSFSPAATTNNGSPAMGDVNGGVPGVSNGGDNVLNQGPVPLHVPTPSNNPDGFQPLFYQRPPLPAHAVSGFTRSEEYMKRIEMSLVSGLHDQQEWAVEALLQVTYQQPDALNLRFHPEILDYLLETIANAPFFLNQPDEKTLAIGVINQSDEDHELMQHNLQVLLTLRNASMTPTNAHYLAQREDFRHIIERGLGLPRLSIYSEFRGYCVEMAEAVSFHITPTSPQDTFFITIIDTLTGSEDRSVVIPALRALSRLVIQDKKRIMEAVPMELVHEVSHYLLVDDEELISAALDFLYQYTASKQNVHDLFSTPMGSNLCTRHLVRLLTYKIVEAPKEPVRLPRRTKKKAPSHPPPLPDDLVDELLQMEEPARATQWIRCSYEEDSTAEVTQISLWKAYEGQFSDMLKQGRGKGKLLPGVHFINNVTPAFKNSAAMVNQLPNGAKSYVIRGIKPREYAVTPAQLNAPPPPPPKTESRQPSAFGVTACLVLENIAQSPEGCENLQHVVPELMRAMLLNSTIVEHVQELLDILAGETNTNEMQSLDG